MPLVDDMEEESAIPRRVKQDLETVSVPVLHDFRDSCATFHQIQKEYRK